jgi:hypothetical protein
MRSPRLLPVKGMDLLVRVQTSSQRLQPWKTVPETFNDDSFFFSGLCVGEASLHTALRQLFKLG